MYPLPYHALSPYCEKVEVPYLYYLSAADTYNEADCYPPSCHLMNNQKLFEFYEKLYFHEMEVRERIVTRLQMPFAILLSILSLYAYMLQGVSIAPNVSVAFFGIYALVSIGLFAKSVFHFIRAFHGSQYELIPTAKESEQYRATLTQQYKSYDGTDGYEDCDTLVSKYFDAYLFERYVRASTNNGEANDRRAAHIHDCIFYIIVNSIPLLSMFLTFSLCGINKADIDKELQVKVTAPIELKSSPSLSDQGLQSSAPAISHSELLEKLMSNQPLPPPPPPAEPPEPRYLREGVDPKLQTPPSNKEDKLK
ncbi:conserved hypothetical protein [Methylovorus sp. MP688]|nr:conserved hypothetical protein [Methylovorus sp. MP688]